MTATTEETDPGTFERVCALADLTVGEAALADVGGAPVALVRTEERAVHAVGDRCSHGNVSLSEGDVEGCTLECWLHGSAFDLVTGAPTSPPATTPIPVYPVKIEGDDVYVSLSPTNERRA